VSTGETILLGALAGATIFIGLPLGRIRNANHGWRAFLNAIATGILLFLLFDILENAIEPLESAVRAVHDGTGSAGTLLALSAVFVVGFGAGLLSLLYLGLEQRARRGRASLGPGAMAVAEQDVERRNALALGMSIAVGIGLHNFSEGLAIGQSAKSGEVSLALLLVIGFALHNTTEGFGIVGPLAAEGVRPSWGYLLLAGLIAGGPTFLGTIVGTAFDSTYVFVAFLAVAAGAIVYVIAELLNVGRRMSWRTTVWGLFIGFIAGLATELILVAAGA